MPRSLDVTRRDSNPGGGTRAGVSSLPSHSCARLRGATCCHRLPGAGRAFVPTLPSVCSPRAMVAAGSSAGFPRCAGTESSLGCRGGNLAALGLRAFTS